ncbi:hypothetical protein [Silanimonas sp.]|jgi:hypothetical protein|uniref:hypothetical protein n=1 Tax=Silanimonas sp. TaxID=1929290 RepID=UPI0037C71146
MSGNPFLKDAFWYAEDPAQAPTFEETLRQVQKGIATRDQPEPDMEPRSKLTAHQRGILEICIESAEILHSKGRTLEAWGFLCLPIQILAFHDGVDNAEFREIDKRAKKLAAIEYGKQGEQGKQGKQTKTEAKRLALEAHAADLVKRHQKTPFTLQRELRDEAFRRSPNGGETGSDGTWVTHLLKQPALAEIYASLGPARKRQQ